MEQWKNALKLQANLYNANKAFVCISDLDMNRRYMVNDMTKVQTPFGPRIVVSLQGDGMILKIYLPKSLKLNDTHIEGFNSRDKESVLYLVYKGRKMNGAYKIDFE